MMTSNRIKIYLFFCLLTTLFSCENIAVKEYGNGNIETKEIELDAFTAVKLSGNFEVILEKSASPVLRIVTDENLMRYIETEVRGGRLNIYTIESISSADGIKLFVGYTNIDDIEVSGAVSLSTEEPLISDDLELSLSGAGSIEIELESTTLELDLSGAGAVDLAGQVDRQEINMSGAGGLDAYDLISRECNINISGVGGADIHVTEKLYARVSGVGSINYRGNPDDVNSDVSGLGSIDRKN